MSKRGADTRVKKVAHRIVAAMDSEGVLRDIPTELEEMLHRVQSEAISLSVSTSELIGLMKRQDPEYAAEIDAMENPPGEVDETLSDELNAEPELDTEPDEAVSGESDEPESEDEKD